MAGTSQDQLLNLGTDDNIHRDEDDDGEEVNDIYNEPGNMGYDLPSTSINGEVWNNTKKIWELNYHEAAIFLQEGENNDKYTTHPRSHDALPAYEIAHNHWFYALDLFASLLVLFMAACERPAVPFLTLPVGVHGALELFGLLIIALELGIRMKWLGWKVFFRHIRTVIKTVTLSIMFIETIVVMVRQTNHFRVTRALRPLFIIDTYYCRNVRRICRQILQSLPPIVDMIILLLFFMLIFSILGFYLFSQIPQDTYFTTIQDSFISLFVLLTTANYPDVMMPAYAHNHGYAIFFIIYLALELYFLMNLLLAVVYDTFSNLEKSKLKKLFFHKRVGCRHAFRLLVTKRHSNHIQLKHFAGMMKYFRPKKTRREIYLTFKIINTSMTGTLSLDEFYNIYDTVSLQWSPTGEQTQIWSSKFRPPWNKLFSKLHWFINWKWFEGFVYLVIAANFIWILIETIQWSVNRVDIRNYEFQASWASFIFVCLYTVEAMLKILGKGPKEYFTTGWDAFDFIVTFTCVIGVMDEFFAGTFYFFTVLRPFRLLRLFKIKKRYRDVLGTFFVLLNRLLSLAGVIVLVYYFFSIIGMEVFLHVDLRNCCKNTSVEDFYKYSNDSFFEGYYYLNNFENILVSGVTLFELTVVNNWFIIMEGYAHHVGDLSRTFFMLFYIVMMVVMNIVLAFILELFLFRIQYRRALKLEDIDAHSKHVEEVSLTEEEELMCCDRRLVFTGHHIHVQQQYPEIRTPFTFRGERFRRKDDFSLRMYSDEVTGWIEEDQAERDETIESLGQMRVRQRANAHLQDALVHRGSGERTNSTYSHVSQWGPGGAGTSSPC
ncbi:two pore channel protein 1-like [Ylistrum balloti]|uniref:two pore channel protein 1-like n=1 Tax=Ylistrum balloti TaxID=509963 RepID=UPI0029059732|nr:two pore channel protein 1-like [Ylistrum balloti]